PTITNLVFLRRVNSRILYEQMLGRATRTCPEIGKETFRIFDAVDLYPHLKDLTEMKPVVVNTDISLEQLFEEFARLDDAAHRDLVREQILVKKRSSGSLRNHPRPLRHGSRGNLILAAFSIGTLKGARRC